MPASIFAFAATLVFATDGDFTLTAPPPLLVAPLTAPRPSLIEATIEPTKHELRFDNVLAAERWEQNFQLAARLPLSEALSLRQEVRSGIQNETILGDEFTAAFRDALAILEKTSVELRASEAAVLAASVQQQWLATNSIPFAEIVTYGAEAKFSPVKTTTLKLQVESLQREEFLAAQTAQETYRLAVEQELFPKRLKGAAGVSFVHFDDELIAGRASLAERLESSLQWTPLTATTLTLGAELSDRDAVERRERGEAYALKMQQQVFTRSKIELQAGYELRTRLPADAEAITTGTAWTVGANSDFTLRDDLNAGFGLRYRLREDPASPLPLDEVSVTLSVKGKF